jgi:hypothetical protein
MPLPVFACHPERSEKSPPVILSAAKNPRIGICLFLPVILAQPESLYWSLLLPFRREQGASAP